MERRNMERNGYVAKLDRTCQLAEQYWVYTSSRLVGWIRYHCGVLVATNTTSTDPAHFPTFLIHEPFGPEPDDYFPTNALRREALVRCLDAISECYTPSPPRQPVDPETLHQDTLFSDSLFNLTGDLS